MKLSGFFIFFIFLCNVKADIIMPQKAVSQDETSKVHTQPISLNLDSQKKKSKKEVFYKCTKEKEFRWMRLYYLKNGKCKTEYSKGGKSKEVGKAVSYETCESVISNIKRNLEIGGFNCEEKILMGALVIE